MLVVAFIAVIRPVPKGKKFHFLMKAQGGIKKKLFLSKVQFFLKGTDTFLMNAAKR